MHIPMILSSFKKYHYIFQYYIDEIKDLNEYIDNIKTYESPQKKPVYNIDNAFTPMDRSQLGKTTASVSSYWALLHHYKRPFFFFFSIFEKVWIAKGIAQWWRAVRLSRTAIHRILFLSSYLPWHSCVRTHSFGFLAPTVRQLRHFSIWKLGKFNLIRPFPLESWRCCWGPWGAITPSTQKMWGTNWEPNWSCWTELWSNSTQTWTFRMPSVHDTGPALAHTQRLAKPTARKEKIRDDLLRQAEE